MIICNKCKHKKWLRAVQESGYVLWQIGAKTAMTPRVKSRSVLKAKLAVLKIQEHPKNSKIEEIMADIPKGEINQTRQKSSIPYHVPPLVWGITTRFSVWPRDV